MKIIQFELFDADEKFEIKKENIFLISNGSSFVINIFNKGEICVKLHLDLKTIYIYILVSIGF